MCKRTDLNNLRPSRPAFGRLYAQVSLCEDHLLQVIRTFGLELEGVEPGRVKKPLMSLLWVLVTGLVDLAEGAIFKRGIL